jgi:hypothetical protein
VITYERMTIGDATFVAALGGRVHALREAMGLSLRDLAQRADALAGRAR